MRHKTWLTEDWFCDGGNEHASEQRREDVGLADVIHEHRPYFGAADGATGAPGVAAATFTS
jgi:hypothetical protein